MNVFYFKKMILRCTPPRILWKNKLNELFTVDYDKKSFFCYFVFFLVARDKTSRFKNRKILTQISGIKDSNQDIKFEQNIDLTQK